MAGYIARHATRMHDLSRPKRTKVRQGSTADNAQQVHSTWQNRISTPANTEFEQVISLTWQRDHLIIADPYTTDSKEKCIALLIYSCAIKHSTKIAPPEYSVDTIGVGVHFCFSEVKQQRVDLCAGLLLLRATHAYHSHSTQTWPMNRLLLNLNPQKLGSAATKQLFGASWFPNQPTLSAQYPMLPHPLFGSLGSLLH